MSEPQQKRQKVGEIDAESEELFCLSNNLSSISGDVSFFPTPAGVADWNLTENRVVIVHESNSGHGGVAEEVDNGGGSDSFNHFCNGSFLTSTNLFSEPLLASQPNQQNQPNPGQPIHSQREIIPLVSLPGNLRTSANHFRQNEEPSRQSSGIFNNQLDPEYDVAEASFLEHVNDMVGDAVENELSALDDPSLPSIVTPMPAVNLWNWVNGKDFVIQKQQFIAESGWSCELNDDMSEMDYWKLCLLPEMITKIVNESNEYAERDIGSCDPDTLSKRKRYFKPITENDLLRYIAIRIIMGIDKKPEYAHYWSKDPIFHSIIVPQIMSIDRFLQIQKYLHFCDNEAAATTEDKLYKIRELWTSVVSHMQSLINPGEALSIDESLTKFRGRLSFRQFIPSKRNRFGVKSFSLVDKETGYVVNSIIYTGKSDDEQFKQSREAYGYGGAIVLELCDKYIGKNHTIYCDNYFSSPCLAENLLEKSTYLCGTLRSGRKNSPSVPKMKKGDCAALVCEKNGKPILIEYWKDKRIVRMISTGISHEMVDTVSRSGVARSTPKSIDMYNHSARGIDLADMAIAEYDTARKTLKWYMKLFFRLLDLTIYNSFAIMKTRKGRFPFLDFRVNLVKQILESTGGLNGSAKPPVVCDRINAAHYPTKFQAPRRCKVCSVRQKGKNVRSKFGCSECNVGLCTFPCFGIYHKLQDFS